MAKSAKSRSHDESQDIDMDNPEQQTAWQERQRMIAEAAYFRALNRGFQGGDPADDWVAAEIEISVLLPADESGGEERARKQS